MCRIDDGFGDKGSWLSQEVQGLVVPILHKSDGITIVCQSFMYLSVGEPRSRQTGPNNH